MDKVYDFDDYKLFVRAAIRRLPKKGFGQVARMAQETGINQSLLSQIFSGPRDLSESQAYLVARFFGLSARETYYFLVLVQKQRVDNPMLKELLQKELEALKKSEDRVSKAVEADAKLSPELQAEFYANWLHVAILTALTIDGARTVRGLATILKAPERKIVASLGFLSKCRMIEEKGGKYRALAMATYLEPDSPLIALHHTNWRVKALEKIKDRDPREFFLTAPFSVSHDDFQKVRAILTRTFEEIAAVVKPSTAEEAACLNIDFFQI